MSPGAVIGIVIAVIVVLLVIAFVVSYNRFMSQKNLITESWKQVDVELQRRFDLIPNLIETVKGYAAHEKSAIEGVTAARTNAEVHQADGPAARQEPESVLGRAVGGLLAVAEAYPDLKASANFLELQKELALTEDRIAAGRRFYNGNVRAYNTRIQTVPSNLIASMFKFTPAEYFEIDDPEARKPVKVQF
jgi:LemA protein